MNLVNAINSFISSLNPLTLVFISALLGAYLNSIFEWIGYRKQKRAELKIKNGEIIHEQISIIIVKLNEINPYFAKMLDTDGGTKAYWVGTFILPLGLEISNLFVRLSSLINFNTTIIAIDLEKITMLSNNFSDRLIELGKNYSRDNSYINATSGIISSMMDDLSKIDIALRHEVFSDVYRFKTLRKQKRIVKKFLAEESDSIIPQKIL